MNTKPPSKFTFNWQSFISVGLLLSFAGLLVSGIVLYVAPEGGLSRWVGWNAIGLTKKQWEQQHTVVSFLFFLFCVFHIFKINWRSLFSYFFIKNFRTGFIREIVAAFILFLLFFTGTLFNLGPFTLIIKFGNNMSERQVVNAHIPPVSNADKLSLQEFAFKLFRQDYKGLRATFTRYNWDSTNENTPVDEFCNRNHITPEEFYIALKKVFRPVPESYQ